MQCNYIELGGKDGDIFRRKIVIDVKDKEQVLKRQNFTDTYSTIYRYDNKNQDMANIIGPLYIDLDINDLQQDFEKLKRDVLLLCRRLKTMFHLTDDNLQIFFSGSKGFHILVPHTVFGIKPSKDLNDKYKLIALELKSYTITKSVDTRIYDSKRLFREPNTINSKTGLYKVQMSLEQIRDIKYEELLKYASTPKELKEVDNTYNVNADISFNSLIEEIKERQRKTVNHKVARQMLEKKELLPCVKYILQHGAQKGGRNNTTMALASALYQREPDNQQVVLEVMQTWNYKKLDEPLSDKELEATVLSAYRNVQDGKRYGCGAFMDMGICVKGCPVRIKR